MSIAVIDNFFAKEAEENELFRPKKKTPTKRTRGFRRRMFLAKEKKLPTYVLKEKNYCYKDNRKYVFAHLDDILKGRNVEAHGICINIVNVKDKEIIVSVENHINNSSTLASIKPYHRRNCGDKVFYLVTEINNSCSSYLPIYYRKYYPNSAFGKLSASRSVRNYSFYDEEGIEIAPSNGNWYKKVFSSWEITDW